MRTMERSEGSAASAKRDGWTLAEVVSEVGVPAETLRSWESRYGWPEPRRSKGGHRRYGRDHLRQIKALRDEVSRGYSPRDAVPLLRALEAVRHERYIDLLNAAATKEDASDVVAVLDDARRALDVRDVVEQIVIPALREAGPPKDESGHVSLFLRGTREWLTGQLDDVPETGLRALLTCAPEAEVSMEAAALAVLLSSLGWTCRLEQVGSTGDVERLIEEERPAVLVVWCARAEDRRPAIQTLRRLREKRIAAFYCGDAFATSRSRKGVPGVHLGPVCMEAAVKIRGDIELDDERDPQERDE